MMKKLLMIGLLTATCFTMLMTGRDYKREATVGDYIVTCTLDSELPFDSATLLVFEENYHQLRLGGTALAHNGTFTFKGQVDGPKAALIRWDNDSTHPFHFVLEPGETVLSIQTGSWSASGSPLNADYLRFIKARNGIINARVATWQEYLKAAADSSLSREEEMLMVRQDSLLNDSLQRITVERINQGDAVARIIRERYASQLDQEHMRLLK